ncbi:DnaJ -like protein subfamily C member 13 [Halotydeus destructor]|nr:DnaJ -like protein subfamily C member 13 [Halotydeus destructor]
MANTKLVREALAKGAPLFLLNLFANSRDGAIREKSADLLSRMTSDKLIGPKIRLILCKFLPLLFVDAMKDSPQAAVHLYDGTQENPELIWTDEQRKTVSSTFRKLADECFQLIGSDVTAEWSLPEDMDLNSSLVAGEYVVAGVYLRLFVQNASWVLRRPKEFLTELLDSAQNLMRQTNSDENHLELVTKSIASLLQAQPTLLNLVPVMGHMQSFVKNLSSPQSGIAKSCLLILRQFAESKQCVDTLVEYEDTLNQLMAGLRAAPDLTGVACEALDKMFTFNSEELVLQAIKAELIPFLLKLLDAGQSASQTSSTKAVIVNVLKAMRDSTMYGEQVGCLLDNSTVWAEFKDQRHDLFISNVPTTGYLTAGANVAGYLTQGPTSQQQMSPPPIDEY